MLKSDIGALKVSITTSLGAIIVEIHVARAPLTGANFLRNVDLDVYCQASFYRAVRPARDPNPAKIKAVQGGVYGFQGGAALEKIAHEDTDLTGLRHRAGTLSMARDGLGSADSEFFIVIDDCPELDAGGARHPDGRGFAAFGKVIAGMRIVRAIWQLEHGSQTVLSGMLDQPVPFLSVRRLPS